MKTAIRVGGPTTGGREQFEAMLELATEAEKFGVDSAWSAEAWGMDAIAPIAFLAARTERLKLGTGIMQLCARTPAATAMTALSMDTVTNGRFLLGLGNSGPQVVEGLHGQSFDRPATRMREIVEIIRLACTGEKLAYDGKTVKLPLPGGPGKALRISQPPARIPIFLATLAPRALEMTGAIADGWLGTSFTPDAADAHFAYLRKGAEKAGRRLDDLTLCVDAPIAITGDPEKLFPVLKNQLAFQLSAMGSPTMNFYNDAYARGGFEDACREVRDLWLQQKRPEAVAAVPDAMVMQTAILGDEAAVRTRLRRYAEVGIDLLMLHPIARDGTGRLDVLGRATEMVLEDAGAA
ncbi:MAG: LLM class flavin-dependent oxidoreductase [Myxococcota bacterium]